MDVANLTCSECGYESGMSENKALRELAEQQAERIKELEADLLEWKVAHSTVTAERDALKDAAKKGCAECGFVRYAAMKEEK